MAENKSKKRWWEILRGVHNEGGRTYIPNDTDEETLEETQQADGPFIYTAADLSKLNPPRKSGYVQRFRIMTEGEVREMGLTPPDEEPDKTRPDFDEMTVAELRAYAEQHDIDLVGRSTKPEILAAVRDADLR
jgi:hypothetical protein